MPTDLFAEALRQYYRTGKAKLEFERDDGFRDSEDLSWYLSSYPSFPLIEKQALRFASGHVLDVGCAAGRHALYLQRRGFAVTGIDSSITLVDLARERGVKDVRQVDACGRLPFRAGEFDTVVLFGNNLGICGTLPRFGRMLGELHRITTGKGRILATTATPNASDPAWWSYVANNIAKKRPAGQVRMRLLFKGKKGRWFTLLLFSPTDLLRVASTERWHITHTFPWETFEKGYSVVLEKE
ncbi:MAG: class I SAM-dependent methyltransferase [Rudaea sp.]